MFHGLMNNPVHIYVCMYIYIYIYNKLQCLLRCQAVLSGLLTSYFIESGLPVKAEFSL
jgi:hypothetical protein